MKYEKNKEWPEVLKLLKECIHTFYDLTKVLEINLFSMRTWIICHLKNCASEVCSETIRKPLIFDFIILW